MTKTKTLLASILILGVIAGSALAAAAKTYQATGPIVALTDSTITVDKGKEGKWEIARDASTKITGDLKVGAKVTIEYRMSATTIEVKSEKPAMEAKPKAEKKTKK